MSKIFIDTNIFLDFYRANKETLKVLDELKKYAKHIVFPLQVYGEYNRNRVEELEKILLNLKRIMKVGSYSTSIINDLDEFKELQKTKRLYEDNLKALIGKVQEMIDDPSKDLIFNKVKDIFESDGIMIISADNSIIEKAKIRQLLGNPPGSNKFCIGDEVIWECILFGVKSDLVIISRDSTYSQNAYIINEEYKQVTGRKILKITESITDALKSIGEQPNEEIVKIEKEQMDASKVNTMGSKLCVPDYWNIKKIDGNIAFVTDGKRAGYTSSQQNPDISFMCPYCGNYGPWNGVMCLSCGQRSEPD
ncbi:PIN domain-containing protein [Clostridium bowmanii]|uniref:PIN domain-containing protein n=1 Tax=Clostridium bowmanii TaxID=132925 RepID=UPI001C0ABA53|nr:PIN domain-containing protein [Clostridium bowmanii]MBU3188745.1 DUF4935 domain-containing protein [Clostridium bowmanii]MCA1073330.1 PIN domain-containing protein [Clostridium bowmanii]